MNVRFRFRHLGLVVGLFFAWLIVQYGFFKAVFVLALAVFGWWVGRVLEGDTDLLDRLRHFHDPDEPV